MLTTWPTRLGPAGEKAGMLGGKVASGARVETCESVVPAVPDLRGCCAVRPSNTPPSTTAASKQTGASQASRGLASSLMAQSLSHMTIPEGNSAVLMMGSYSHNQMGVAIASAHPECVLPKQIGRRVNPEDWQRVAGGRPGQRGERPPGSRVGRPSIPEGCQTQPGRLQPGPFE